jgi:hypothetical protein
MGPGRYEVALADLGPAGTPASFGSHSGLSVIGQMAWLGHSGGYDRMMVQIASVQGVPVPGAMFVFAGGAGVLFFRRALHRG